MNLDYQSTKERCERLLKVQKDPECEKGKSKVKKFPIHVMKNEWREGKKSEIEESYC